MYTKFYSLLLAGFLLVLSQATKAQDVDTTAAITLDEVAVFGKKVEQYAVGSRITTIDSIEMIRLNAGSLADILQLKTPLYIKTYGQGMLSTVAFRGTAASHTAVLWNGFNINLPTLGQSDFSIIPATISCGVDIQHGNSGALYGSGAIGGSVILNNDIKWAKGWNINLQQDGGSFTSLFTNVQARYSTGKLYLQSHFYRKEAENNYWVYSPSLRGSHQAFNFKTDKEGERLENSALYQLGFKQDIALKLSNSTTWLVSGWYNSSDRQIMASRSAAHNNARQKDKSLRLTSELSHSSEAGKSIIRGAFFEDILNYTNTNVNSKSNVHTWQTQAEHELMLLDIIKVKAGGEFQHFIANVDGYGGRVIENRASAFLLTRFNPLEFLELNLNLRQALVQNYNPPITPSVALNLYVLQSESNKLAIKGSYSKGYKVPTLNERFWRPGGNPFLKPEDSESWDGGLSYNLKQGNLSFSTEANVYSMLVDNWVQWQPSTGFWAPVNLLLVHSRGLEYSAKASYKINKITSSLTGSYAYTRTTQEKGLIGQEIKQDRQLYYVPIHTGNIWGEVSNEIWFGSINLNYTGSRLIAGPMEELDPFFLLNVLGGVNLKVFDQQLQVIGRVNNALNLVYDNMENMPMPPRNFSLSLRMNIKSK